MSSAAQTRKYWFDYPEIRGFFWNYRKTHAHSGIDVGAPCGTKLVSAQNGTVISVHQHPWGGQVNLLMDIPDPYAPNGHGTGVVSLLHLQRLPNLSPGAPVYFGTDLGDSGQPPPGGRYGSGCHVHVETSAGTIPPYEGQYDPWYPTSTSYPLDPSGFLISWKNQGGGGGGGSVCGDQPPLSDIPAYVAWLLCVSNQGLGGAIGAGLNSVPIIGSLNALGQANWLNPIRILKLVVGVILVLGAVFLTFIPDVAGVALSAAGQPELGAAVSASASKRKTGRENIVRRFVSGASEQYTGTKLAEKRAVASERAVREERMPRPPTPPKPPKTPKPRPAPRPATPPRQQSSPMAQRFRNEDILNREAGRIRRNQQARQRRNVTDLQRESKRAAQFRDIDETMRKLREKNK